MQKQPQQKRPGEPSPWLATGRTVPLVGKAAHLLSRMGIKKGDRVFIYLNRCPETFYFALGILKLGAVYCPLFPSFGPDAIKERFNDCGGSLIITESKLSENVEDFPCIEIDNEDFRKKFSSMPSEFASPPLTDDDIAIIHYTSGTTGKPKGAVHCRGALKGHTETAKSVLGLSKGIKYWCTADPAWVTGSSYGIFGPLAVGADILIKDPGIRASQIMQSLEENEIEVWYTAPTLLRMLMRQKVDFERCDLKHLKKIFSVGEVLSPEVYHWAKENLGLPIYDTWFQTETGSIMIANTGDFPVKPGSMGKPIDGINAIILDDEYNIVAPGVTGHLAIKTPWLSMFRGYWGNTEKYNSRFKNGYYITGDLAYKDEEGYFYFVSREDDVINTAGHLLSPYEVESVLVTHPSVLEAAVVGINDELMGEAVKAFVVLNDGYEPSAELQMEYRMLLRNRLSPYASPREVEFVESIPKTESGKIIRR